MTASTHANTVLLLAIVLWFTPTSGGLELRRTDSVWQFGNARLAVRLDAQTGMFAALLQEGHILAEERQPAQWFDIREEDTWVTGGRRTETRLQTIDQKDTDTVIATVAVADWNIAFRYTLFPAKAQLRRSARLTWNGDQPTKLKGFWLRTPQIKAGTDTFYYSPGAYPPERYPAAGLKADRKRSFGHSPLPLVAQLSPQRSVVWLTDELTAFSDRASVSVTEQDDGFRVSQGFSSCGHMDPGDQETIGDAWLWVVQENGDSALTHIHEWLRDRGHAVPADRPEWFRRAVLYSLHPGGTIGSGFTDLGGFVPATRFLDHVADLGANAVWIMPIEDAAVYHPRDYYRFQNGLGTDEEYRRLVARAHDLDMHLIQDCVPHGGSNHYPRAKEHPEWLAYQEDGTTLSYWCYDFNWPTWRQYMADVARHYVTTFDLDGFRVDAVGGSKTPNWNPQAPYGRASFAQLQGGLNMLRSLRAAVKETKPKRGGLLAEVGGSVYGSVSDAVYDFRTCYTVFHGLRRQPPELFVARLRQWLHEQQAAEAEDLLRLRHVESHDSLRSGLWYGLLPQRALVALSAWIHGIPLVYHEMEDGNRAVFRRIFAIRRALRELNGGDADYLSTRAPPEVFVCLRVSGDAASVVAVNVCNRAVDGTIAVPRDALPARAQRTPIAIDTWTTEPVPVSHLVQGSVSLPLRLPPFGFTVLALRDDAAAVPLPPDAWAEADDLDEAHAWHPREKGLLAVRGSEYTAWINPRTGLLAGVTVGGHQVFRNADLFLPPDLAARAGPVEVTRRDGERGVAAICTFGDRALELTYTAHDDALRIDAGWREDQCPAYAAMLLPVSRAERWYAAAAAGVFEDTYQLRHTTTDGQTGSIYWRRQGTHAVWDSLLHPFGADESSTVGVRADGTCCTLEFAPGVSPDRVQWLDRIGDRHELSALLAWRDPETVGARPGSRFSVRLLPGRSPQSPMLAAALRGRPNYGPAPTTDTQVLPGLRPAGGGWELTNTHYRLRISRSGILSHLWTRGTREDLVVEGGDVYTDAGFSGQTTRYAASNDVEAASRFHRKDGTLSLRFEGRLRGFNRFEKLDPPVDYTVEYTLDSGPSFRVAWAVKPRSAPFGDRSFLSIFLPVPGVSRFRYVHQATLLAEGGVGDDRTRATQTKLLDPPRLPDHIELASETDRLLTLSDVRCGGSRPAENVFVHGRNFFITWDDGAPLPGAEGKWRWVSALVTPGTAKPLPVGTPECDLRDTASALLLEDPGFELARDLQPVSLLTGEHLPRPHGQTAWLAPSDGRVVAGPVHGGSASAEVAGSTGAYLLWRQALDTHRFPPGSRWRLAAWVKGDSIVRGDISWKVGTLRFALLTEKTSYASCEALTGTFDWRQTSAECTVPDGLQAIRVETGLNGATGRMWIDDVTLERLDP